MPRWLSLFLLFSAISVPARAQVDLTPLDSVPGLGITAWAGVAVDSWFDQGRSAYGKLRLEVAVAYRGIGLGLGYIEAGSSAPEDPGDLAVFTPVEEIPEGSDYVARVDRPYVGTDVYGIVQRDFIPFGSRLTILIQSSHQPIAPNAIITASTSHT